MVQRKLLICGKNVTMSFLKSNPFVIANIDEDATVSYQEVYDAVMMLKDNKACGMDKITAEHLKFASSRLCPLLAICFTGFLVLWYFTRFYRVCYVGAYY